MRPNLDSAFELLSQDMSIMLLSQSAYPAKSNKRISVEVVSVTCWLMDPFLHEFLFGIHGILQQGFSQFNYVLHEKLLPVYCKFSVSSFQFMILFLVLQTKKEQPFPFHIVHITHGFMPFFHISLSLESSLLRSELSSLINLPFIHCHPL